ncbi:hypothetical protein LZ30DRAFT_693711 [Colletotrichum cereale]|nr:hypothetical protein LZ30DRAFT_693711 [Colletotrichum cereale]
MKLLAMVAHGAALALCSPLSMVNDTKAAAAPGSDAFLQARASDFGPNAPEELYYQAVKARKAAGAPSLEPNRWYYFMSCGLPENTQAGSKDGVTLIKPRPPPKQGRPPLAESEDELRAKKDEPVWKSAQQQVKEQTGCDHVGFVVGKLMTTWAWPSFPSERWVFSAELHYVEPYSTVKKKTNDLSVAMWTSKTLSTAEIPGNLKYVKNKTKEKPYTFLNSLNNL